MDVHERRQFVVIVDMNTSRTLVPLKEKRATNARNGTISRRCVDRNQSMMWKLLRSKHNVPTDDLFIDSIQKGTQTSDQDFAKLSIGQHNNVVNFKLDTGSQVNTLPNYIYCKLGYTGRGLQMISLIDKSVSDIITIDMNYVDYVATSGDKLYYTNLYTHTVTCCDLHDTIQWKFNDEPAIQYQLGISIDNDENVYVVGGGSKNVVVISPNGQRHRQLLTDKDGLEYPTVLDYVVSCI